MSSMDERDAQMTTPTLAAPRSGRDRASRTNYELYAWLFMRMSGVALVVLVIGHLVVNLVVGDGISGIDFGFVANKWANPFWQVYDLLLLWLAQLHGTNGLRTVINDYAEKPATRLWLKVSLYTATIVVLTVGTLTIFTFDPCLDPESTLAVCLNK